MIFPFAKYNKKGQEFIPALWQIKSNINNSASRQEAGGAGIDRRGFADAVKARQVDDLRLG